VQACHDVRGVAALADDATGKATMRPRRPPGGGVAGMGVPGAVPR
jgi:hypothetical protein